MDNCYYTAEGEYKCDKKQKIEHFSGRPAFISDVAKQQYWAERSENGFPVGATEWQVKGHEKQGSVSSKVQKECLYSTQGTIICPK
jgi:hypothetical protein